MSRFTIQIEVPRGIQETFAFVSDFRNTAKWDPGVQKATMLSPEPVGLASTFCLESDLSKTVIGQKLSFHFDLPYEVVAFEPPELDAPSATASALVRMEGQTPMFRYVDFIRLRGTRETTTLEYDAQLAFVGVLFWCRPFSGPLTRAIGNMATQGMRAAILDNVPAPKLAREPLVEMRHAP